MCPSSHSHSDSFMPGTAPSAVMSSADGASAMLCTLPASVMPPQNQGFHPGS